MPASLADYQTAAEQFYAPQQQAEARSLVANRDETINSQEAQKGQVNTNYEDLINKLTQSVQDETAQIKHTYSDALGGNFSGLIGNDLGMMFTRANQQQGIIGETRANKLNEITANETNANIEYSTNIANLTPKYQTLKNEYASGGYAAAVKAEKDQANLDRTYQLSLAKLGVSQNNKATTAADKISGQYKVVGKNNADTGKADNSQGYSFTGPNNKPVTLAEYAQGKGGGSIDVNDVLDLLQNGSSYDQAIYRQVKAAGLARDPQSIINLIAQEDKKNYYGFGG